MVKRTDLQSMVYEKIRDKIIACEYSPGTLLKEELLKVEYDVSRTPIREALARLENEGLIVIKPKKGILVTPITMEDVNEVFEIRELYELYAIREYGRLISFNTFRDFYDRTMLADCSVADKKDFFLLDDQLHRTFLSPIRNIYIHRSYGTILAQNNRMRFITGLIDESRLNETKEEHVQLLRACMENNWVGAEKAMREHLRNSKATVFDYLLTCREQN